MYFRIRDESKETAVCETYVLIRDETEWTSFSRCSVKNEGGTRQEVVDHFSVLLVERKKVDDNFSMFAILLSLVQ